MPTAYLALGSNLGDRHSHLVAALKALHVAGIPVTAVSSIYETAPVGPPGQADYFNAVVALNTSLHPHALLDLTQSIEQANGRIRHERWGSRTLDLDLLLYGDLTLTDVRLTLPHPHLLERAFVLIPLAEIAPDLRLSNGHTAAAQAAAIDRTGVRSRLDLTLS